MQATFYYNFKKRKNSTLRPTSSVSHDDVTVTLKQDCDINNPVFLIASVPGALLSNIGIYNYVYVSSWANYYFVTSVKILSNTNYEISCTLDVLATAKYKIATMTTYVERTSDPSIYDKYIEDNSISSTYELAQIGAISTSLSFFSTTGCYILRVVNNSLNTSNVTFLLTATQMQAFLVDVFLQGLFENKLKYITVCKWVPLNYLYFVDSSTPKGDIKLSDDSHVYLSNAAYFTLSPHVESDIFINRPGNYYNDFRDYSRRFTSVSVEMLANKYEIPAEFLWKAWKMSYSLDFVTASVHIRITAENDTIITLTKEIGIDIQLSSVNTGNAQQAISSLLSAAVGGYALNGSAVVGGLINGVTALTTPSPTVIGTTGNASEIPFIYDIRVYYRRFKSSAIPATQYGRPTQKVVHIDDILTGSFIKCGNASISIAAHADEIDAINNYLNNGFFYE